MQVGSLEQSLDVAKDYLKNQLKQKLKKQIGNKLVASTAGNPLFWIVVAILLGLFLFFFLIASAISSTQEVANTAYISEKLLPPQIYIHDLENRITDGFGERTDPITGKTVFHEGVDIGVPVGTPISSAIDGVIKSVSFPKPSDSQSIKDAGIFVTISGTDTEIDSDTRYLHLSQSFVTPGQVIKKGDIIGLSGSTGRSTGAHLHFEITPHGQTPIDPAPFILMMSKVTDTASDEAIRTLKKISWTDMNVGYQSSESPTTYQSPKMLYISDIYMENAPPTFNPRGTAYVRGLFNGGSSQLGTIPYNDAIPPLVPPDAVVTVPTSNGSLTDPFLMRYAAAAQAEEQRSGVPASITLAQAALESGYGQHAICNNFFGIKANSGYTGAFCTAGTNEEYGGVIVREEARFRSYSSPEQSFADHSNFLLQNGRYQTALSKANSYEFANELQKAGYATDSQYSNKLKSIIRSQNLTSLDRNRGIDPITLQPFEDVPFSGSGGGSGTNTTDSITVVFGIQQLYGSPAQDITHWTDIDGYGHTNYSTLNDPYLGQPIINLVNYNNVLNYYYGHETMAPNIAIKDIPQAIAVTVESSSSEDLYVSRVEYVKGTY